MLFDAASGELLAETKLAFQPEFLAFNTPGSALVAYGQEPGEAPGTTPPGSPQLLLAGIPALEEAWAYSFKDLTSGNWCLENCEGPHEELSYVYWQPALAYSAARNQLYILHADENKLTVVDFAAREVNTMEVQEEQSWFEELLALTASVARAKGIANGATRAAVLSPDGARLYAVGRNTHSTVSESQGIQVEDEFIGLLVVDTATGKLLPGRDVPADGIKLTADGKYLLLHGWSEQEGWTEVVDAESLESVAHLDGWQVVAARQAGGAAVLLAQDPNGRHEPVLLDPITLEMASPWQFKEFNFWIPAP
jgi:hypothetical protein